MFQKFIKHFELNKNHFSDIDWEGYKLSNKEKWIILSSLQQFQKGESSEGKYLMKFAEELGLPDYKESVMYFIKEEQTHAKILAEFMKKNDISRISEHWVDNVFRFLRKIFSLENSVMVLLTAEIIAAVYYDALYYSTKSETLRSICSQILKDEAVHIDFQSTTLGLFHKKHGTVRKIISRWNHLLLMQVTIGIVWIYHRRVCINAGYSFKKFYLSVMGEFRRSEKITEAI